MKIKPDKQEKIFLGHLTLVTVLVFLAHGSSQVAEVATSALQVLTYPLNLVLQHEELIPAFSTEAIVDQPVIAYGIAATIVPLIVINSYLWAFVLCHIKWQWRVENTPNPEAMPSIAADPNNLG